MEKIRAAVFDLDRTLLRDDKTISAYTRAVLDRLRERGMYIVIATARPPRVARRYEEMIGSDGAVTLNGASVRVNGRGEHGMTIGAEETKRLLRSIERMFPGRKWSVEMPEGFFAGFDTTEIWPESPARQVTVDTMPAIPAYKVLLDLEGPEDAEKMRSVLPEGTYLEIAEGTLGMVMHERATKLNGVKAALDALEVPLEEAAAFGDDLADIGMLRACGFGVAVEYALDEVKAAADFICASNGEDGPAKWLEERTGI